MPCSPAPAAWRIDLIGAGDACGDLGSSSQAIVARTSPAVRHVRIGVAARCFMHGHGFASSSYLRPVRGRTHLNVGCKTSARPLAHYMIECMDGWTFLH